MFMALELRKQRTGALSESFPSCLRLKGKRKNIMKTLKQLLFAVAVVIGLTMSASAQKDGDKKTPPKEGKPPIVVVEPKKPKDDKPKDDRKKPQAEIFYLREE